MPDNIDQETIDRLMEAVKIVIEEVIRIMNNLLDSLNDGKDEIYKTVMVDMLMEHLSHMGGGVNLQNDLPLCRKQKTDHADTNAV